ncbi:hypothetical protein I302_103891 [Kwoniella bestiolae CBS 10118]|uniref:Uncharacterized protein n=1 Tax=Kwoniella bestiolae CBS 10118 TaxID=1296100 RepID=A0A1B9G9S4_9TREE|nr:hypothetical protein I302_02597 [Kwoniella bestiolae CBS 10118]OCF27751.1 hypothetical protein I302_02597 [Kwoniella bestiolae CBS 10118]
MNKDDPPPTSPTRELYSPIRYPLPPSPSPWRRALSLVAVPSIHRTTSAFGSRRDKDKSKRLSALNGISIGTGNGSLTDSEDQLHQPIPKAITSRPPPETVNPFPHDTPIYEHPAYASRARVNRSMSLPFSSGETDISMINHYPTSSITSLSESIKGSVDTSVPRTEFFSTFDETPPGQSRSSDSQSQSQSQSQSTTSIPCVEHEMGLEGRRELDPPPVKWEPERERILDTPQIPVPQNTIEEGLTPTTTPSLSALTNEESFFHVDRILFQEPSSVSIGNDHPNVTSPSSIQLQPSLPSVPPSRPRGPSIAPFLPLPPSPPSRSSSIPFPPFLPFPYLRSPPILPGSIHPPSPGDYLSHTRSLSSPISPPIPPIGWSTGPSSCPTATPQDSNTGSVALPGILAHAPVLPGPNVPPASPPPSLSIAPPPSTNSSSIPAPPSGTSSIPPGIPTYTSPVLPSLPNIPHIVWLPYPPGSGIPPPTIPGFREGRPIPIPALGHPPAVSTHPPVSPSIPTAPQVSVDGRGAAPGETRNIILPDYRELVEINLPKCETTYVVDSVPALLRILDRETASSPSPAHVTENQHQAKHIIRSNGTVDLDLPNTPSTPHPLSREARTVLPVHVGRVPTLEILEDAPSHLGNIERELYELSFPSAPAPATPSSDHPPPLDIPQTHTHESIRRPQVLSEGQARATSPPPRRGVPKFDWRRKLRIPSSVSLSGRSEVPRPPPMRRDMVSTLAVQGSATPSERASTTTTSTTEVAEAQPQGVWWIGEGEKHHDPLGDLIIAERDARWRISIERFKGDSELISHLSQSPTKIQLLTIQAPSLPCQPSRRDSSLNIISIFLNYLFTHDTKELHEIQHIEAFESFCIICDFFGCPTAYRQLLTYFDEKPSCVLDPWEIFVIASKRGDRELAKVALRLSDRASSGQGIDVHKLTSGHVKDVKSGWVLELFNRRYHRMTDGRYREVPWEVVAERFNPC